MKIFGAINDGYSFIYSLDKTIMEDWLYVYQESFCLLKLFKLEIAEDTQININSDMNINFHFNKKDVPQHYYNDLSKKQLSFNTNLVLVNGLAFVCYEEKTSSFTLELNQKEKVILQASRNFMKKR